MTETEEIDMRKLVKEKANWTSEELEAAITAKIQEFRGFVDRNVALSLIAKDLKIKEKKKKDTKTPKKTIEISDAEYPLSLPAESVSLAKAIYYPSEGEVLFLIERRKFVKKKLIDPSDIITIKRTGMEPLIYLKKSGTQKYINAFGISIEMLNEEVHEVENNVIAECKVKAIAPTGQYVIAVGTKEKREYWSEKYQSYGSYNLHALKATARTRAIHIAVSDLVGYGDLSAADLTGDDLKEAK